MAELLKKGQEKRWIVMKEPTKESGLPYWSAEKPKLTGKGGHIRLTQFTSIL